MTSLLITQVSGCTFFSDDSDYSELARARRDKLFNREPVDKGNALADVNQVLVDIPSVNDIDDDDVSIEPSKIQHNYVDVQISAVDVEIEGVDAFESVIEITLPYDDSQMEEGERIEECLAVGYKNEETGAIEPVIYRIDEENKVVIIETNHLTSFWTMVFGSNKARESQCNSALTKPMSSQNLIHDSGLGIYQDIIEEIRQNEEPTFSKILDSTYADVNFWNTVAGNSVGLASKMGVNGEWLETAIKSSSGKGWILNDLVEDYASCGKYMIIGQAMVDLYNGKLETANDNLMKNLAGYALGAVGSIEGIATFAIDYSLNELGNVLMADKREIYLKGYNSFYEEHERNEEIKFVDRMYKEVLAIYKKNMVMGFLATEHIKEEIHTVLMDYCNLVWKDDFGDHFGESYYDNLLDEKVQKELSMSAYNELMKDEMQEVFIMVQKQLIHEAEIATLNKMNALEERLKTVYNLSIKEVDNYEVENYQYGNAIIRFDVYEEALEYWTFQLDEKGQFDTTFLAADYMMALAPEKAYIYKDYEAMNNGEIMDSVDFTVNEGSKSLTILLGGSVDFEIETSYEQNGQKVKVGDNIWFSVTPDQTGYTYQWNYTDTQSHTLDYYFVESGTHLVEVEVIDTEGLLVGYKSVNVEVEDLGNIQLVSDKQTLVVEESVNLEVHEDNELIESDYLFVWDFGDGRTTSGSNNLMEYYYTEPGEYTVTVDVRLINYDGIEHVLKSSTIDLLVNDSSDSNDSGDNDDELTNDNDNEDNSNITFIPVVSGTFANYRTMDNQKWYDVYIFDGNGGYTFYREGFYNYEADDAKSHESEGTYHVKIYDNPEIPYYIGTSSGHGISIYTSDLSGDGVISLANGEFEKR